MVCGRLPVDASLGHRPAARVQLQDRPPGCYSSRRRQTQVPRLQGTRYGSLAYNIANLYFLVI